MRGERNKQKESGGEARMRLSSGEDGNWGDDRLPMQTNLYPSEISHPKMASSQFLKVSLSQRSGP